MAQKIKIGLVELPVITYRDEGMYVSEIPIFNIASQGKNIEESISNLKEAVELYFEGEDVDKLIAEKFPQLPNAVIASSMTFDTEKKQVIRTPVSIK